MANEPQKTEKATQGSQQQPDQRSQQMTGDQRSQSREMTRDQRSQSREMTSGRRGRLARTQGYTPFSPFSLMRRMFEDLERMTQFATNPSATDLTQAASGTTGGLAWIPDIDITRRDERIVVHVDLPGLAPDDIRVVVDDDAIVLEGERRWENVRDEGDVWQAERTYGRFRRVIPLPEGAKPETAEARFENGVLEIAVRAPETSGSHRRTLDIKGGEQPQSQQPPKRGNGG
ncbi:MAG: heat shock protein Hsp20 [Myxococcales bacterium]|nr:heat shock protein Hsp20 [Myxococcales bacterium]